MAVVTKSNKWAIIKANLSLADKSYAAVGFPGEAPSAKESHGNTGMNNIQVAIANEFGSAPGVAPRVPARPFLRQTFSSYSGRQDKFQKMLSDALYAIAGGRLSTKIALERIGLLGSSAVKEEITHGSFVPNAPFTIAKKKSSKPLIDTGAMRQAVTHKVRMKSGRGMDK